MAYAFDLIAKDRGAKICLPGNQNRYYRFDGSMWVTFKAGDKERDCYDDELVWIAGNPNWEIYEGPTEVEVFEWMFQNPYGSWVIAGTLFTEDRAKEFFANDRRYRKTGRSWKVPVI